MTPSDDQCSSRVGIILAGGSGTRLAPATSALNKHLLPVYDKPMIYYPLTTLMLSGIRKFVLISTPLDLPNYQRLLQDGSQWGLEFHYLEQQEPKGIAEAFLLAEAFLQNRCCSLILGDNIFFGPDLSHTFPTAEESQQGATIFAYHVSDPGRYGVVLLNDEGFPLEIEEKPVHPRSNWAVTGIYFYDDQVVDIAKGLTPSQRGELEITDVNKTYLNRKELQVRTFDRGTAWLDTGTHESLIEASTFVHVVEARQGMKIGCPEETAWRMGYITDEELLRCANMLNGTPYANYLRSLIK